MKIFKRVIYSTIAAVMMFYIFGTGITGESSKSLEKKAEQPPRGSDISLERWVTADSYDWKLDFSSAVLNGSPVTENTILLNENTTLTFPVELEEEGNYSIMLKYKSPAPKMTDCFITAEFNNNSYIVALPILWRDSTGDYSLDKYGNELVPEPTAVDKYYYNYLEEYNALTLNPIIFNFSKGENLLKLTTGDQSLEIAEIVAVKESKLSAYEKPDNLDSGNQIITLEGEKYTLKSSSYLRGKYVSSPSLNPYDTYKKKINTVDGNSWDTAGQKLLWEFEVPSDGYYKIGFHYSQSDTSNKDVYRSLEIDGRIPFEEMANIGFAYTGTDKYENLTVKTASDEPMYIWLEKGMHTLSLKATAAPYVEIHKKITALMAEINELGMSLRKLTAGQNDKNRTWDMDLYMPDALPKLEKYISNLENLIESIKSKTKKLPSYAAPLKYAVRQLKRLAEEPRVLPNKAEMLNIGDNSVSKSLGQVLNSLVTQPLSLDRIYIFQSQAELPESNVSVVKKAGEWLKKLFYSFSGGAAEYQPDKTGKELKVWINRPIQYVEALQQIIDSGYNAVNNTNIKLSIMPDEQKLILAGASGTTPDVVLGVNYFTPFEFAIRGAAKNLLEYDGFLKFYASEYNIESLVPLSFADGVYGAVETLDFQVLFYRTDIMKSLELEIPDTWTDVKNIMPVLLRNSMNFGFPLASGGGFKSYHVTSPFVYQNGGQFYTDNGMSTGFEIDGTMEGFREMTDLFKIYGGRETVANFYNSFRYSEIPIGISGFSTYMQLVTAAPELSGRWSIALTPGTLQKDGSIKRYQVADSTACMIFENTKKSEEAGKFMMWWLSQNTQSKYSNMLRSTYGEEYTWNTANLKAFAQMDYPNEHKQVILSQWQHQKENLRHPANYMVEREVSNIWNNVVVNNKSLVESVDKAKINSNREIIRKLAEFGYCDKNGNIVKDYNTKVVENLKRKLAEGSAE